MKSLIVKTAVGAMFVWGLCLVGGAPAVSQEKDEEAGAKSKDVVDTLAANKEYSTLVKLIKQAGLAETLKGKGPYTVFAPTNKAFEKVGQEKIDQWMEPENRDQLKSILTYHVVQQELTGSKIREQKTLKTLNGQTLTVKEEDGKLMLDKARVTLSDTACKNGVIQSIDAVLMPKPRSTTKAERRPE